MVKVIHNSEAKNFLIELPGAEAILHYREPGGGVLDFYSTFVPPQERGHGLAKLLTETGLQYARENDLKVHASCSYVARYFEEHPEVSAQLNNSPGEQAGLCT
jgi:predicted GNAT family acetyltransferase